MEKVNIGPVFGGTVHLHISLPCENGDIIIQYIDTFLCVGNHFKGIKTIHADNNERSQQATGGNESRQPDFGFNIFDDHDYWR